MKKLIGIVGILLTINAQAELIVKMPVKDYIPTDLDYIYQIETDAYQKITLDCLGFVKGMRFYYNNEQERLIYMEESTCEEVNNFFLDSKKDQQPICMELNADENSITFSREVENCR